MWCYKSLSLCLPLPLCFTVIYFPLWLRSTYKSILLLYRTILMSAKSIYTQMIMISVPIEGQNKMAKVFHFWPNFHPNWYIQYPIICSRTPEFRQGVSELSVKLDNALQKRAKKHVVHVSTREEDEDHQKLLSSNVSQQCSSSRECLNSPERTNSPQHKITTTCIYSPDNVSSKCSPSSPENLTQQWQ